MRELWPETHFISLFLIFGCTFWQLALSATRVQLSLCSPLVLFQIFLFVYVLRILPSPTLSVFSVAKSCFANVAQFLVLLFTDNGNLLILISPSLEIPRHLVRNSCGS